MMIKIYYNKTIVDPTLRVYDSNKRDMVSNSYIYEEVDVKNWWMTEGALMLYWGGRTEAIPLCHVRRVEQYDRNPEG